MMCSTEFSVSFICFLFSTTKQKRQKSLKHDCLDILLHEILCSYNNFAPSQR